MMFGKRAGGNASPRGNSNASGVDWLVVGLGNPGKKYEFTRHNAGFLALDRLSRRWDIPMKKLGFQGVYGSGKAGAHRVLLLKPQTFMNLSGESVRGAMAFYKLPVERLLVVYDDVSLALGRLRIRTHGSDGGHNGIGNILLHCRSDAFPRIKLGVGSPTHPEFALTDWVLGTFDKAEYAILDETIERALDAVEELLQNGPESAMNRFN